MKITAEEKLMYKVMKAIYDSGIPISFKGAMVLKACLMEAGYTENTRHTVDIDANWNSDTPPSGEQMIDSLQSALKKNGISLDVSIYRMYGEGRSAGFDLADKDTGEILFSMDIDVNRPVTLTKIYEVDGLRFRGVSPSQMIADKVSAVSTDKVFRRIKDVVDLYYISKVFDFDKAEIMQTLSDSGRSLNTFNGFLHRTEELRHSYEKFRFAGDVSKLPFEEIYRAVKSYLKDVLPPKNRDYER
ncbi:MAG: nucleotidyl transferase AbiEii/AbiGii toxin family protein [Oscillospiraceae bacterium]|nr:nucleotidyl transferase AbiEii/AbiGii toxin family protein [Oscillospiraceae bacterium]